MTEEKRLRAYLERATSALSETRQRLEKAEEKIAASHCRGVDGLSFPWGGGEPGGVLATPR